MLRIPGFLYFVLASLLLGAALLVPGTPARAENSQWRIPADFEGHPALLLGASQLLFHHPEALTDIASALAGRAQVFGLVSNPAQARVMHELLLAHGIPADAVQPVVVPVQSMWVRDYGPVFVQNGAGEVGIVDARYGGNLHNPDDEHVPTELAGRWDVPLVESGLWLEGGQILSNGQGLLLVSTALFTRNAVREEIDGAEATARLQATLPFERAEVIQPLHGEPTGHLDMFLAFLAPDLIVVARIDPGLDPINAERLDTLAVRLEGMTTDRGPLRVVRVDTPAATDGVWRTYTNCAMVGDVILVPSYPEVDPRFDRDALALYRRWMPDRDAELIESSSLVVKRGALHCVSMPIPAGPGSIPPATPSESRGE